MPGLATLNRIRAKLTSRAYARVCRNSGRCSKRSPCTGLDRPLCSRRFRLSEFLDNRHTTVARLSARRTGLLYPQKIPLILIAIRGCVDPTVIVRPEGLSGQKMPINPSGIKAATFHQSGWPVSCPSFEPATFSSQKCYCLSQIALSGSVFDDVVSNNFTTIRFTNTVFCRMVGA